MSDYKVENTQFGTKTSHPSYGTLAFSRRTGGRGTPLFGSSIEHRDTIAMTLYHADITRGLHYDSIYGDKKIVEVEMSYSQFAEVITSMNMGSGVPVTVRWTERDGRIPDCDFISKREQFADEFKEKRKEVGLTQKEFSIRSSLGLRFIRELEQGKETVRMDKVNQALAMFGMVAVPGKEDKKQ